ncbi:MAG: hypothetical protein KY429_04610 [Actinobacteria bacterium]|nr:hypothetical protein [Actinomycetota bacterium]
MILLSLLVPIPLLLLAFLLAWMEERVLAIDERQELVLRLLEEADPDDIELAVSQQFGPVIRRESFG